MAENRDDRGILRDRTHEGAAAQEEIQSRMKAEITSIKIRVGTREIEFTSDEARKVHEELSKLFAVELPAPVMPAPTIIPVPYPVPVEPLRPWRPNYEPIWIAPFEPTWRPNWEFTCVGAGASIGNTLSITC